MDFKKCLKQNPGLLKSALSCRSWFWDRGFWLCLGGFKNKTKKHHTKKNPENNTSEELISSLSPKIQKYEETYE